MSAATSRQRAAAIGAQWIKQFPGAEICVYRVLGQIGRSDL